MGPGPTIKVRAIVASLYEILCLEMLLNPFGLYLDSCTLEVGPAKQLYMKLCFGSKGAKLMAQQMMNKKMTGHIVMSLNQRAWPAF